MQRHLMTLAVPCWQVDDFMQFMAKHIALPSAPSAAGAVPLEQQPDVVVGSFALPTCVIEFFTELVRAVVCGVGDWHSVGGQEFGLNWYVVWQEVKDPELIRSVLMGNNFGA